MVGKANELINTVPRLEPAGRLAFFGAAPGDIEKKEKRAIPNKALAGRHPWADPRVFQSAIVCREPSG